MKQKHIRLDNWRDIASPGLDGYKYRFDFSIGDIDTEGFLVDESFKLDIGFSGSLLSTLDWRGLADHEIPCCAATLALKLIRYHGGKPPLHEKIYCTANDPGVPQTLVKLRVGECWKLAIRPADS